MKSTAPVKSVSLFLLICLTGLPQLSETIYTPSLPAIARSLHTSDALVQWTLSIYFIGFAVGVFSWGKLADHLGRRPPILMGMTLYTIASLLCYFSTSIYWLLVCRFFQALGVSTGSVVVQTIARDIYTPEKRAHMFAVIVGVLAFAPALGPLIGGEVTEYFNWSINFIILVLLGFLVVVAAYLKLPETRPEITSNTSIRYTVKSVASSMMKDSKILTYGCLVGIFNGLIFSFYSEAPFIFVTKLHLTYSTYGRLGIFLALASFCGAFLSRRLSLFYKPQNIMKTGCLLAFICSLLLVYFSTTNKINAQNGIISVILIIVPTMGIFASLSLVIPFALSQALENYKDCLGTAGSLLGLGYYSLVSLITFTMGLIHNGQIQTLPLYFLVLTAFMVGICFNHFHYIPVNSCKDAN